MSRFIKQYIPLPFYGKPILFEKYKKYYDRNSDAQNCYDEKTKNVHISIPQYEKRIKGVYPNVKIIDVPMWKRKYNHNFPNVEYIRILPGLYCTNCMEVHCYCGNYVNVNNVQGYKLKYLPINLKHLEIHTIYGYVYINEIPINLETLILDAAETKLGTIIYNLPDIPNSIKHIVAINTQIPKFDESALITYYINAELSGNGFYYMHKKHELKENMIPNSHKITSPVYRNSVGIFNTEEILDEKMTLRNNITDITFYIRDRLPHIHNDVMNLELLSPIPCFDKSISINMSMNNLRYLNTDFMIGPEILTKIPCVEKLSICKYSSDVLDISDTYITHLIIKDGFESIINFSDKIQKLYIDTCRYPHSINAPSSLEELYNVHDVKINNLNATNIKRLWSEYMPEGEFPNLNTVMISELKDIGIFKNNKYLHTIIIAPLNSPKITSIPISLNRIVITSEMNIDTFTSDFTNDARGIIDARGLPILQRYYKKSKSALSLDKSIINVNFCIVHYISNIVHELEKSEINII